ncbi:MAG TPA: hypothetical protein VII20_21790, partial [Roseiarcus sp.]
RLRQTLEAFHGRTAWMAGTSPRLSGSSPGGKTGVKTSPSRRQFRLRILRELFSLLGRGRVSPKRRGDRSKTWDLAALEMRVETTSGRHRRESFSGHATIFVEPDSRGLVPAIHAVRP